MKVIEYSSGKERIKIEIGENEEGNNSIRIYSNLGKRGKLERKMHLFLNLVKGVDFFNGDGKKLYGEIRKISVYTPTTNDLVSYIYNIPEMRELRFKLSPAITSFYKKPRDFAETY